MDKKQGSLTKSSAESKVGTSQQQVDIAEKIKQLVSDNCAISFSRLYSCGRDTVLVILLLYTVFGNQNIQEDRIMSLVRTMVTEERLKPMIEKALSCQVEDFKRTYVELFQKNLTKVENDYSNLKKDLLDARHQIKEFEEDANRQHVKQKTAEEELANFRDTVQNNVEEFTDSIGRIRQSIDTLKTEKNQLYEETKRKSNEINEEIGNVKNEQKLIQTSLDTNTKSCKQLIKNIENEKERVTQLHEALYAAEKKLEDTESIQKSLQDLDNNYQELDNNYKNLDNNFNIKVRPNLFDKGNALNAFMLMFVMMAISFIYSCWLHSQFKAESKRGTSRATNSRQLMAAIPRAPQLDDAVCIISFYEDRQDAHKRLLESTNLPNCRVVCHVVRRHDDIRDLPSCKVYLMCVEFSERHVIIEEPGLGLGDLHRSTYEAVEKLGGKLIILYTKDTGSRNLADGERFNSRIWAVTHQEELVKLNDDGRFFSVYDTLTASQKTHLRQKVMEYIY